MDTTPSLLSGREQWNCDGNTRRTGEHVTVKNKTGRVCYVMELNEIDKVANTVSAEAVRVGSTATVCLAVTRTHTFCVFKSELSKEVRYLDSDFKIMVTNIFVF